MSEANPGVEKNTKPLANTNPFLNDIDCADAYENQNDSVNESTEPISVVFSAAANESVEVVNNVADEFVAEVNAVADEFVAEVNAVADEFVEEVNDVSEVKDDSRTEDGETGASKPILEWSEKDEGVVEISWQLPEGSATPLDYITLCYIGSRERVGVGGRVPATGCARGDIMWLLDEPNQPYEDCEQLLCFRYYNGDTEECVAETPPLPPPTKFKLELKKLPLRLKEGASRKRSGDHVSPFSPFSYSNESFEMSSENPRMELVAGPSTQLPQEITHLSENVDKCSISSLDNKEKTNLEQVKCDNKSLFSNLGNSNVNSEQSSAIDRHISTGVKKKCPPPVDTGGGQSLNGVKKKIKGNNGQASPTSPTEYYKIWSPKNPCKIMKFVYDVEGANVTKEAEKSPVPPLPPRKPHKVLERTHAIPPPHVPRNRKPKSVTKPEDTFTFELIDTDEQFFTDTNITNSALLQGEINDFKPGEFYSGHQAAVPSTAQFLQGAQNVAPLATPETDGSLFESTVSSMKLNKILEDKKIKESTESQHVPSNKIMFIKDIGPDNYITTTFARKDIMVSKTCDTVDGAKSSSKPLPSDEKAQHRFLSELSSHSFEDDNMNQVEDKELTLKGHKPLTRQISGRTNPATATMVTAFLNSSHVGVSREGSDSPRLDSNNTSCSTSPSQSPVHDSRGISVGTMLMNRKYSCDSPTPKHSSLPRHLLKNLGCEGTPKHSPSKVVTESPSKPHSRALTRMVALACSAQPQCPPTPTHHARKLRPVPPPDLEPPPVQNERTQSNSEEQFNELRTSEIRSPNLEFMNRNHFTIVHAGPPDDVVLRRPQVESDSNDNTVASPTPLRHMAGIRLPSIPERTSRQMALTGDYPVNMIGGIIECEEPLPAGWEARMDSHGRVFYIDHVHRSTTWSRPADSGVVAAAATQDVQRSQLDRRYQSIRRTMTRSQLSAVEGGEGGEGVGPGERGERGEARQSPPPAPPAVAPRQVPTLPTHPAAAFLCRPDLYSILHMNQEASELYNSNSTLKHMVSKIRRDLSSFSRYEHNRDLVALVNLFACGRDLPLGWDTKLDSHGKRFFVDHVSRRTSFLDPRMPRGTPGLPGLPRSPLVLRREADTQPVVVAPTPPPRPAPPPAPRAAAPAAPPHVPVAYDEKVVAFLRQPNIMSIVRERGGWSPTLRHKVNAVRTDGVAALRRYKHDLQLTCLLSLFEQEIMSYVPSTTTGLAVTQPSPCVSPAAARSTRAPAPQRRDFEAKLRAFYRKLETKGYGQGPGKLKLHIRRENLLEDAFRRIMSCNKKELQKGKLCVIWDGEEGLDYGGPSREFFFLLSRELFNPYYGLFEYSANDTYTVHVSPMATFLENYQEWFRFAGRVLGLALVHGYLLEAWFTRALYRALLRLPPALEDVEALDAQFAASLRWLQSARCVSSLELTFAVSERLADGRVLERDLKPGGRDIPVTDKNKKDYLERIVRWRLERGQHEQTECVVRGFHEVVDPRLVVAFDARELELVIAGACELDVADWRNNTDYRGGYHDTHPVVIWFWQAIDRFTNEQRLRLVQFVTGTSSIPFEGFCALRGSNGPRRFCIERWGRVESLPRAHTCFNRLDLPPYPTPQLLHEKLLLAVEETNTFAIE